MDSHGRLRRYPYSRYQPIIQHLTSPSESIHPSIYLWLSALVIKPCNTSSAHASNAHKAVTPSKVRRSANLWAALSQEPGINLTSD